MVERKTILVAFINAYQRYISPRKGFICAHRVLHGGMSCSESIKAYMLCFGHVGVWGHVRRQFSACAQAHMVLLQIAQDENSDKQPKKRKPPSREDDNERLYPAFCCADAALGCLPLW